MSESGPAAPRLVAFGVFVVYLLAARGVGNFYPLSTFEMYGSSTLSSASRIVVRDESGAVDEVDAYTGFACDHPVDPDPRTCLEAWPFDHVPAMDAAFARTIDRSRASSSAPRVEIVRRVWRFEDEHTLTQDCVLARCRAARP